jgi:hypothetical protein
LNGLEHQRKGLSKAPKRKGVKGQKTTNIALEKVIVQMEGRTHREEIRVKEKKVIGKDERTAKKTVKKRAAGERGTVNGKNQ